MKRKKVRLKPRVLSDNPNIKSHAALVLLNRKFYELTRPAKPAWRIWLSFRNRFLKKVEKKHGTLECFYCGLKPLYKNSKITPYKYRATIDHVLPRSRGGREYDESNLVVCCAYCNHRKGDKLLRDFARTQDTTTGDNSLSYDRCD